MLFKVIYLFYYNLTDWKLLIYFLAKNILFIINKFQDFKNTTK